MISDWRVGEAFFNMGTLSCNLCWCYGNDDHWKKAKKEVRMCVSRQHMEYDFGSLNQLPKT
jgi:hypothetical protein